MKTPKKFLKFAAASQQKRPDEFKWHISAVDNEGHEVTNFYTDADWGTVEAGARQLINQEKKSGSISLTVHHVNIFGNPEDAPQEVQSLFKINPQGWVNGHHLRLE